MFPYEDRLKESLHPTGFCTNADQKCVNTQKSKSICCLHVIFVVKQNTSFGKGFPSVCKTPQQSCYCGPARRVQTEAVSHSTP